MVMPSAGSLLVSFAVATLTRHGLLVRTSDRGPFAEAFTVLPRRGPNHVRQAPPRRRVRPTDNDKLTVDQVVRPAPFRSSSTETAQSSADTSLIVHEFWDAYNKRNVPQIRRLCDDADQGGVVWDDYDSSRACHGIVELERRWRLEDLQRPQDKYRVEVHDVLVDQNDDNWVGVPLTLHYDEDDESEIRRRTRRGCAVMKFSADSRRAVQRVDLVAEQEEKVGEAGLQLLKLVSPLLSLKLTPPWSIESSQSTSGTSRNPVPDQSTAAERYFQAWNRRNMSEAIQLFADNVTYDDTAFPTPFVGTDRLRQHLELCASAFPPQLTFEVDSVIRASGSTQQMALWHAANNGEALPYTRGCSLYHIDDKTGLIVNGLDFVEPNGPIKPGDVRLPLSILQAQFTQEPVRWIPVVVWASYMYVVFFSDGILPGANALVLEERTWKEVLDLSLNFFLVAPLLHLPFSPEVHPILEAVFNLLLSWAALFAGFLSDDRNNKPNLIPFLPTVVGMQFLTSAFLLPYLATRSSEPPSTTIVTQDQTSRATQWVGENRLWGPLLGVVGAGSIVWAFVGRPDAFGTDIVQRWDSFVELLSIDRVGSSFLVDLVIFALFQGWLVDDDLKRRGLIPGADSPWFAKLAKYVPFFGLAVYLALRPSPSAEDDRANSE